MERLEFVLRLSSGDDYVPRNVLELINPGKASQDDIVWARNSLHQKKFKDHGRISEN